MRAGCAGLGQPQAVIPGGSSVPVVPAGEICDDVLMDFDALARASRARHGGGDRHGQVDGHGQGDRAASRYFYKHESCGQCTPCREGTGWMWRVLERMAVGEADGEIDMLLDVSLPDRGPHHLRAGRRGGLAGAGPDPPFPRRVRSAHRLITIRPIRRDRTHGGGGVITTRCQRSPSMARSWTVEPGTTVLQARGSGVRGPALLLPRAPVDRRQLPHVSGRGEGRAEAAGLLRQPVVDGEPPEITRSATGEEGAAKG